VQTSVEKSSKEVSQNWKWLEGILYCSWIWWNYGPSVWSWPNEKQSKCQSASIL